MARIDPKNDELGMMENIFRGVCSVTSGPIKARERRSVGRRGAEFLAGGRRAQPVRTEMQIRFH